MSDELDAVLASVRERVVPEESERDQLEAVVEDVLARTEAAVANLPVEADVLLVGSTARDTWLAGDRDVDVFVRFPTTCSREELEDYGLQVGHEVLPEGHEEYAEHPYVVGECDGFEVDLVPCFAVDAATEIRSAVDRTPFHTEYVADRLEEDLADDVRLCKQFLTGIGAYGSDLRTRGFSGFLTELLVLAYGGFRPLVEAVADWQPPVELDPEDHGRETFDDPLVVVDPTDPERNVAAVCSPTNVARFQHYARELLADPRESLFEPRDLDPLSPAVVRAGFEERGTTPVAVVFDAPDLVDDQLYPQLERSLGGLTGELDRRGFDVLRADAFADESAVLLAELAVAERPQVERHEGPPVHVGDHAGNFLAAYADREVYGPFIDGDRYVVERERTITTAKGFLESDAIFDVALGTHVESALGDGYDVLVGDEVGGLAEAFGRRFAAYLSPRP